MCRVVISLLMSTVMSMFTGICSTRVFPEPSRGVLALTYGFAVLCGIAFAQWFCSEESEEECTGLSEISAALFAIAVCFAAMWYAEQTGQTLAGM